MKCLMSAALLSVLPTAIVAAVEQVETGQLTARDLVQAGINDRRLTPDRLNNQHYLFAVESELQGLSLDSD